MLGIVILAFGYWMSIDLYDKPKSENNVVAEAKQPVAEKKIEESSILDSVIDDSQSNSPLDGSSLDSEPDMIGETGAAIIHDGEKTDEEPIANKAYYLVKEVDGLVRIFHYDTNGNEEMIRATDIEFSLISEEDQTLFSRGIVRYTKDELNELLQDFES